MEITAAAAQATTYTTGKTLAEQINDYLAVSKTSIATLASEIPGYSRPTISRYLSGKYEGDISTIEKLLADWLAQRTGEAVALPEPGRKTGRKPVFYESRDALKVLGVCQSCQEYIGLGIVVARSGYGKTYSLRQYAKLPRVAYVTVAFVWSKKTVNGKTVSNLAPWTLKNCELCLMGTRGRMVQYKQKNNIPQLVEAVRTRHSEKPEEVRRRIEELFGDVPRIELFARKRFHGWDCWGNEV